MEGGQTSRFRGVIPRKTGKWGAQVSVDSKQLWLGTFEKEEDAAIAYDRVSLKLLRISSLNFPLAMKTPQEIRFQSMYPLETIISMVKFGTYARYYAHFLSYEAILARGFLGDVRSEQQESVDAEIGGGPEVHKPVMLFSARID